MVRGIVLIYIVQHSVTCVPGKGRARLCSVTYMCTWQGEGKTVQCNMHVYLARGG